MGKHKVIGKDDAMWLAGADVSDMDIEEEMRHEQLKRRFPLEYVRLRLDALEVVASDLRKQADALRDQVKDMRRLISEDDF